MILKNKKRQVESLHGILQVSRCETPPPVFFAMQPSETRNDSGVLCMDICMEEYVRLEVLSESLKRQIHDEIKKFGRAEVVAGMHKDTRREVVDEA